MTPTALEAFITEATVRSRRQAGTFLEPPHYRSSVQGYTRNLIYDAPDASLSLYSIVWLPGQWTPVHDHGS